MVGSWLQLAFRAYDTKYQQKADKEATAETMKIKSSTDKRLTSFLRITGTVSQSR